MSHPSSANQPSSPADPASVPVTEPGFEVKVQALWGKYRGFILLLCAAILLAIIARELWQYVVATREKKLQQEYAQVSDKPEKLGTFAEANSSHPLGGVAYLQIADTKFEATNYKEALSAYTKAAGSLKTPALLGRAKLGAAVSQVAGGDVAAGETALKALAADQALPKVARAEATYHLASLAYEAGRMEEVRKLVEDVAKIDLSGQWSQRATMLLSTLPEGKGPDTAGGVTFKPESK